MSYLDTGKKVLQKLNDQGFLAYFVGGVVRDIILENALGDIDINTNAKPDEVMALFQAKPTGIKYGTVTIYLEGHAFEVTTFRVEGEYIDNRHPSEIHFTNYLDEDLSRRDYTINAMAMDVEGNIVDHHNGMDDLAARTIRAVGNPAKRYIEDALRMLRAFYFVAKLGFDIHEDTLTSISKKRFLLKNIASERQQVELKKMIKQPYLNKALKLMVKADFHLALPGLKRGIEFFAHKHLNPTVEDFYAVAFTLNEGIPACWRFSKVERRRLEKIIELALVTEDGNYTPLLLYSYGKELCIEANRINHMLRKTPLLASEIKTAYKKLPIHRTCELVFKGQEIMKMTNRSDVSFIGNLVDDIVYKVLMNELDNSYETIKNYVSDILKEEVHHE